jgi:hypothetical protein
MKKLRIVETFKWSKKDANGKVFDVCGKIVTEGNLFYLDVRYIDK